MTNKQVLDRKTNEADPASASHGSRLVLNLGCAHVGTLVALSAEGVPMVDFPGNLKACAVPARSCVDLDYSEVGREVVLMFDGGDFTRPLLMGCLRDPAAQLSPPVPVPPANPVAVEGNVVRMSAIDTLSLRCGKASVTLTRDGSVLIGGNYVETRASGTNRIQGGSVRIN